MIHLAYLVKDGCPAIKRDTRHTAIINADFNTGLNHISHENDNCLYPYFYFPVPGMFLTNKES